MQKIEPCCAPKHLLAIREQLKARDTVFFYAYGDFSLSELLPALLIRYCETDMLIAAPSVPDVAAEAITKAMRMSRAKMTGQGRLDVINHLTLVTDLREKRSPAAAQWMKDNPYPTRLTLRDTQQADTAIILPDIALVGPINLTYGNRFTAIATNNAGTIKSLRSLYTSM